VSTKRNALISLAAVAGVVAVAYAGRAHPSLSTQNALHMVPRATSAIARIDVGGLRGSKAWRVLVHERGGDSGLEELTRVCGFDPLEDAEDLLVFIVGDGDEPMAHVGFILRGHFDVPRLSECVGHALAEDGAELQQTEVEGLPAVAGGHGDSRFAFVGQEAIIGGSEATVASVARVIAGREPNASTGPLAASYASLRAHSDSWLVGQVPPRWGSPLRQAVSTVMPELAPALSTPPLISLGLRHGEDVRIDVRLDVHDAHAATQAKEALEAKLRGPEATLGLASLGLRGLPDQVQMAARGTELGMRVTLTGALLDRVLDLIGQGLGPRLFPHGTDTEYQVTPSPRRRVP